MNISEVSLRLKKKKNSENQREQDINLLPLIIKNQFLS